MQIVISLSVDSHAIDIKCSGPAEHRSSLFRFQSTVCELVVGALSEFLPGVSLEHQLLSVNDLANGSTVCVQAYAPRDIRAAFPDGSLLPSARDSSILPEDLVSLVSFGSEAIFSRLTRGTSLPISVGLSLNTRRCLATLLDPPDHIGHDWCLLAVSLGLARSDLEQIDCSSNVAVSATDHCLAMWSAREGDSATIDSLLDKLSALNRPDAIDAVLANVPLFVNSALSAIVLPADNQQVVDFCSISPSYDSNLTVSSSVSR
jgi:death-associated protein kinase